MRRTSSAERLAFAAAVFLACASPAAAQDSRAAAIAAEQAEKAGHLAPYVPSKAERTILAIRREFLDAPSGLYPYFGSVYAGGGFSFGGGFRQYFGDRSHWDIKGLYSLKNYKLVELTTDSWGHAQGRLDLHGRLGWRDATQIPFYGIGSESPREVSSFRMKQTWAGGDLALRPGAWTVFRAGAAYEDYRMLEGLGRHPSIEERHTPASAPGLGVNPTYIHTTASGGIEWRRSHGYARRGGLYAITYHNYADRDDTHSFDRIDGEIVQHIPVLRETWVISLHGLVQSTLGEEDDVPYFLMPSLGSGSTLRGYDTSRFRDRHSLLISAEWRWTPNRAGLDMAIFYDTGKVAARREDLDLKDPESNVGVGVRFHSPFATPLRVEVARGSEGLRFVFAGSAAF